VPQLVAEASVQRDENSALFFGDGPDSVAYGQKQRKEEDQDQNGDFGAFAYARQNHDQGQQGQLGDGIAKIHQRTEDAAEAALAAQGYAQQEGERQGNRRPRGHPAEAGAEMPAYALLQGAGKGQIHFMGQGQYVQPENQAENVPEDVKGK
jgi:hypothetical protein